MKSIISLLALVLLCGALAVAQTSSSSSYNPYDNNGGYGKNASSPMISNGPVAETVSDNSAFIGWSTKEAASSTSVKYGTTRDHLTQTAQATDNTDGKNHHARLENLSANTTYYFQVTQNGEPMGGIGTFKTVDKGEKPIQSKAVISQK